MNQEKSNIDINWLVKPQRMPEVVRSCSKCGCKTKFVCSGCFRVNGQKKKLDVWLIYKCHKCDTTWNMDIMSRVHPGVMDRELFAGFTNNSYELAVKYAFDVPTLSRNKAEVCYDDIEYEIIGEAIDFYKAEWECINLVIAPQHNFSVKLARILKEKLKVSASTLDRIIELGGIYCDEVKEISKHKLKKQVRLQLKPQIIRSVLLEKSERELGLANPLPEAI